MDASLIDSISYILASGGVALLVASFCLYADIFFFKKRYFNELITTYWLPLAFILSVGGIILTLLYSEIFGFTPCGLCWFQRAFLYPQAFITGTAIFVHDRTAALYGLVLSIPGLIIALYQHYLQMGGSELVTCPATAAGDCAQRTLFEFHFMTFPLLAGSLFLFLIAVYYYAYSQTKTKTVA